MRRILIYVSLFCALFILSDRAVSLHGEEKSLKSRGTIYITGDKDFTKPGSGGGCECVTEGSGSVDSPYIIEGWDIEVPNAYGIYIENTTAPFVIRDVKVHDVKRGTVSGIFVYKSKNGVISNSAVANNKGSGIVLSDSENFKLLNNTVENNGNLGIVLMHGSNNNTVEGNAVTKNHWGIRLEVSNDNRLMGNKVGGNGLGMFLRGSNNQFQDNAVEGNSDGGINFDTSKKSVFNKNKVCDNKKIGIALYSSEEIELKNNVVCNNEMGIYLEQSSNNLLEGNKIAGNTKENSIVMGGGSQKNNRLVDNTIEPAVKDRKDKKANTGASGETKTEVGKESPKDVKN
jgi:parallel beta-helix repeat protein